MLMKNIFIKVLLLIIFFSNNWAFGQSFEKRIDSNFNGSIIYCSEINDSYLFLGYQIENNQTKLCCFKTDKSGNVILKNNSILINNVYISNGYYPYNGAAIDNPLTPNIDERQGVPRKFTGPVNTSNFATPLPTDFTEPTRLRRYLDPTSYPPFQ